MQLFKYLVGHFFQRFFDSETVSPRGDTRFSLANILGLLAMPGVMIPLFLMFKYAMVAYVTPANFEASTWFDKMFFITWAMGAMGIITVLEWDALFPDRRDYAILTPLPLRMRTVFAAKLAALVGFLTVFSLDIVSVSPGLYPLVVLQARPKKAGLIDVGNYAVAHFTAVLAATAFIFLFLVALEGLLMVLLGNRGFRRVSRYAQFLTMFALFNMFLFFPRVSGMLFSSRAADAFWIHVFPPAWFLGIYEVMLGSTRPIFRPLAETGVRALIYCALAAAVAYGLSYARVYRRSFEESEPASGPGLAERALAWLANTFIVRKPLERASFYFIAKTIVRSARQRLYLSAYVGVGLALVLMGVVQFLGGRKPALWTPHPALLSVPLVVSFFALSGLRVIFGLPAELRANWVFQMAESRGTEALAGVRKAVMWLGVAPLLAALFPIYCYLWGWGPSLAHMLVCVLLSLILMELVMVNFPKIPFTCTYVPGRNNVTYSWVVYWIAFSAYAYAMSAVEVTMMRNARSFAFFCAVLALVWLALVVWRRESQGEGFRLVFDDGPEPTIIVLDLDQRVA